MVRGKFKNLSNKNHLISSEPISLTIANSEYPSSMPEKQDSYLKSQLMIMLKNFKKVIINPHKEIQDNIGKQV